MTYLDDEYRENTPPVSFLIPNWLPATGVCALRAERGAGKSTVMIDLCMRAVFDLTWHGFPIRPDCLVVYIVGEDAEGVKMRQDAWMMKHNRKKMPKGRWVTVKMALDLTDGKAISDFIEYIREIVGDRKDVIFVIDTWQRMIAKAESASNEKDINAAVRNVEWLLTSFSGPCLAAFHPPKHNADTISGSAIQENITHAIWGLRKYKVGDTDDDDDDDDDAATKRAQGSTVRRLRAERVKGAEENFYMLFDFKEIALGTTSEFGVPDTGPYIFHMGGTQFSTAFEREAAMTQSTLWRIAALEKLGRHMIKGDLSEIGRREAADWRPSSRSRSRATLATFQARKS